MENTAGAKGAIGCVAAVLAYLKGEFNELLVVLVILMLADYVLGVIVGIAGGNFDYCKGITGVLKKAGYMLLVTLGFLMDYTITYLGQSVGLGTNTKGMFGYAVTAYLIGTEGLSNLRLMAQLGLPVPDFLSNAFGVLKDKAEQSGSNSGQAIEK